MTPVISFMDLACHGPSKVNPDAFKAPMTLYCTPYDFYICSDYQIILFT